jgi:hypothetical protein
MHTGPRNFEVWRERDWRCEWWIVSGQPQVRLYFGSYLVNELAAGPKLDLQRQAELWRRAAHADKPRT